MARGGGGRRNYVRDASGRFSSTPGGGSPATGGGLAASRKKSSPSASKTSLANLRKSTPTPISAPSAQAKKNAVKTAAPVEAQKQKKTKTTRPKAQAITEQKPKPQARKKPPTKQVDAIAKQKSQPIKPKEKTAPSKAKQKAAPAPAPQPPPKASSRPASKTLRRTATGSGKGVLKGRTVERSVINKRLRAEESRIKGQGVENAVLINRRGRVVHRGSDNDANKVGLGKKGKLYNYRFTATHNHPETGNPGYNPKVKGSRLTAGLSYGDLRAGIVRTAAQIRAVGQTRAYSFKPEIIRKPGVGYVANVRDTFDSELRNAFSYGMDKRKNAMLNTERKFQERIDKAQRQWWNPAARKKVKKLKEMKSRAMQALAATAHYQDQANAMRELRKLGYNITARRNRELRVNELTSPAKKRSLRRR